MEICDNRSVFYPESDDVFRLVELHRMESVNQITPGPCVGRDVFQNNAEPVLNFFISSLQAFSPYWAGILYKHG